MKQNLRKELAKLDEGKYYELTFIRAPICGGVTTVVDIVRMNDQGNLVLIYTRDRTSVRFRVPFRYELDDQEKVQVREIYGDEQKKWAKYEIFHVGSKPM